MCAGRGESEEGVGEVGGGFEEVGEIAVEEGILIDRWI